MISMRCGGYQLPSFEKDPLESWRVAGNWLASGCPGSVNQAGIRAMRRFRTRWRRKQRAPEDLIRFWLGHAKSSVTDGCSKLTDDLEYRLEVAEKIGAGFTVPASMRPMRPGKSGQAE